MKNLLLLLGILFSIPTLAHHATSPLDSLGVKVVNGQYYIMHRVEKGEGLYAIARRYNADVNEIKKANPEGANGLQIGQIILVPIPNPESQKAVPQEEYIVHIVKSGETLYAISKLYNVSVDQIKTKNKLSSNSLDVGQELIIQGEKPQNKEHHENYGGEEKPQTPKENTTPKLPENPKGSYEYNSVTGEVKEEGFAVVAMNETMNQSRSFCLHPTAEVGTIIMVTNLSTNKSVFVRVVGKPDKLENQVVIKLSEAAGKRLGVDNNDRVNVRLNYTR
ncbi:MAG: LysM peptidoglycan-binding domain-containing protein [Bacteroidetes bacterium]|nr:LysM peptidoglycan-binding domain-containing protein [Bacteroidota bacterium]